MTKEMPCSLTVIAAALGVSLGGVPPVLAEDAELKSVEVRAGSVLAESRPEGGTTRFDVGAQAMPVLGGAAQTSPYRAIELAPSTHVEGVDAYGITVDQNFMRVRGQMGYTFSNLATTVEGLPSSVNVGQGAMGNLYDLENVERVSALRGPLAADQGFGFGTLAGSVDSTLLKPADKAGVTTRIAGGSDDFHKMFVRVDSGLIGTGSRLFVSASHGAVDQWRGAGESMRRTLNFGFTQDAGRLQLEVYGAHNEFDRHEYRPLSHAQASDPGNYDKVEFNRKLTGNAVSDVNYHDFNRQHFTESNLLATVRYRLDDGESIVFRPYYLKTNGYRLAGMANTLGAPGVERYAIEQEQWGAVAAWEKRWPDGRLHAGYWFQHIDTIPPVPEVKVFRPSAEGDLSFAGWKTLAAIGSRTLDSPFVQLEQRLGGLDLAGGLRYLATSVPSVTAYNPAGLPNVAQGTAIDRVPPLLPAASVSGQRFDALLPNLSARYALSERTSVRAAYGRNVGYPFQGPLYSIYTGNIDRFQKAGISLQELWDGMKLEVADMLDLGLRIEGDRWYLAPTLYYAKHRNKQVTVFDPRVNLSYQQNGAKATSDGFELEGGWEPLSGLSLFGSLAWNRFGFDNDIRAATSSVIPVAGKQMADTPKFSAKLGAAWRLGQFTVSPLVRYIGPRFGDALESQKIAGYAVADLHFGYQARSLPGFARDLGLSLSVLNLTDKRYIGIIAADDRNPGSASVYHPGAPRTVVVSLSGQF